MIKIITDSAADIPEEQAKALGITVLPLTYSFDDKTYLRDGIDLSKKEFFAKILELDKTPKTSQVPYDAWKKAFEAEIKEGNSIICVTISSAASGTCQSANMAKNELLEEYPDADVTVVDSMLLSYPYGKAVEEAAKLANAGAEKQEILDCLDRYFHNFDVYFVVDSLKWLQKGGRINMATVLVANLVDIHPVLSLRNGLVEGVGKIRGSKNLYSRFFKYLDGQDVTYEGKDIYLIHSLDDERYQEFERSVIERYHPKAIHTLVLGATIGAHAGPGVSGILVYK